jgi:hypothetical protein
MSARPFPVAVALVSTLFCNSCKDLGDELVQAFTASSYNVLLSPGGSATVTLSGGHPPYVISRQPDAAVATASLTNLSNGSGQLVLTGASTVTAAETTEVKVKDSGDHDASLGNPTHGENEIVITIVVRPVSAGVSFSSHVQPIFTNNCATSGCHLPGGSAPFSLQPGQSYGLIVNVLATMGPCAGVPRVKPSDAAGSALYRRLQGTSCGSQMPQGLPPLADSLQNRIRDWINQGALNN